MIVANTSERSAIEDRISDKSRGVQGWAQVVIATQALRVSAGVSTFVHYLDKSSTLPHFPSTFVHYLDKSSTLPHFPSTFVHYLDKSSTLPHFPSTFVHYLDKSSTLPHFPSTFVHYLDKSSTLEPLECCPFFRRRTDKGPGVGSSVQPVIAPLSGGKGTSLLHNDGHALLLPTSFSKRLWALP